MPGQIARQLRGRADFFVSYQIALRRGTVTVDQPSAIYELSSHHSQGSFVIESFEKVTRSYAAIQLVIGVTEARGRTLWRAKLEQQAEDNFALSLEDAVAALLERFPHHQPRDGAEG